MTRMLLLAFKVLGWGVAGVLLTLLLAFLYYDFTEFQPHSDEIAQLIADAHPAERNPPAALRQLLLTENHGDLSLGASRLLIYRLKAPGEWRGGLGWHGHSALWSLLVQLHLSKDEQLAVICSTSFLGRRAYGYEAGAQAYFGRPLAQLTEGELAILVIIPRSPSRWSQHERQEDLIRARDGLLERAAKQPP